MTVMNAITVSALIIVAFLPALLFLAWIRASGKRKREPWRFLILAFLFGSVVAVLIALFLEFFALYLLSNPFVREYSIFAQDPSTLTFMTVIVIAPIVEEAAKLLGISKNLTRGLGSPRSGLVLGAAAGLGFAATENMLYEVGALIEGGFVAFIAVAVIRTFSSALMHASATSVSGYGIVMKALRGRSIIPYYMTAVLMHASFNFFASMGELLKDEMGESASLIGFIFAFLLALFSITWLRNKIGKLS